MFLLSEEEKISFLKVIYSANMFDNHIQDEENDILEALKTDVFGLDDFQKIDLGKEGIVKEINKINKTIPTIYLFNILYELGKFYKRDGNTITQLKEEKIEKEYREIIDSVLDKVDRKDDIEKSQIFQYSREALIGDKKENEPNNTSKVVSDTEDTSLGSYFKKLFN